jgi:phospholipid/cholesterol/gamma-HCH transport system substrate-binding protein
MSAPSTLAWVRGHLLAILVAIIAGGSLLIFLGGGEPHRVRAAFSSAISLVPGLDVQVDGVDVGRVESVKLRDGRAVAELGIKHHWPLPQGTTAVIRYGTTLGLGTRYVQLIPGPASARALLDGQLIPERQAISAVELDQLFNMFDRRTRGDVRGLVGNIADATRAQSRRLGPGIRSSANTLEATSGLLGDLGRDAPTLSALVDQADRATTALAAKQPVIEDLLGVAATTFREFGTRSGAIRASLEELAPALRESQGTLGRVDRSIGVLDGLLGDLKPGLRALRPFIAEARPALGGLRQLAPAAASTLATVSQSAPTITDFAKQAQPFSDRLRPALAGLVPQLACIRPYGPEIAGFLTTWASWGQDYDNTSHYARVKVNQGPTSLDSYPPTDTATFLTAASGGLKYAMPRPPGLNAGKPWLLPECGAGRDALDPSKDPEHVR